MTMRSIPPASSHFADNPVPAPAPTIGFLRSILACSRSTTTARAIRGMKYLPLSISVCGYGRGGFDLCQQCVYHRSGEIRIVDIELELDEFDCLGVQAIAYRLEERLVRLGIKEGSAFYGNGRNAAERKKERGWAGRRGESVREP